MSQEQQLPLVDELIEAFRIVKEQFGGDFNAAVAAAETHLGRMREARQIAGVKTEKKPRKSPTRKKRAETPAASNGVAFPSNEE